ncbi:MAG: hypothetical protein J6Z00_03720 [Clostridia bacterium]|nr:hypothetical protein [Clostridia bacterium]
MPKRRRYTSRNTRRGRYHFAAWLGLVVILLAIIGVVALTVSMVSIIKKANEHTDMMLELYDEAYPLIQYQPKPFASLEEADQSLLLQSAIFRLNEMENVRRLREKSDEYSYKQDEYGRLIIPVETIDESFKTLYGSDIQPQHQTLGESGGKSYTFEYDKANACYYVPFSESSSLYTTIVDKCKYNRKNVSIRVGYALTSDLDIDNHGNIVEPTASKIEYYQWYTFIKTNEDTWVLNSVENEE